MAPRTSFLMAIPKRGTRKIVVDGQAYRWYIRRKQKYWQTFGEFGTGLAVEAEGGHGSLLIVSVPRFFPRLDWSPDDPLIPVVPGDVARHIRLALKQGWEPNATGGTFCLSAENNSDGGFV
ncbi:MAG: hypothetical protein V4671_28320 [Armatimonadota bacterium]